MKNKVREEIAQSFIDSLKEDIIPWEKQWIGGERAFNPITGTKYKGVNAFWLAYIAQMQDYDDPRWCTFNQAKDKGWKIKAGSKGTRIEFFSPYDREEKKKISWGRVKELQNQLSPEEFKLRVTYPSSTYTVFNAKQIDGIPEYEVKKEEWSKDKVIAARDTLFKNMELTFHEGGNKAFYRPSDDSITLPEIEHFKSEYGYLATMLHESAHATGAEKRLNRDLRNTFGTEEYAREELRAEIASAFTAQEIGLSNADMEHTDNHKAYVQNWISVLKNEPQELFRAIRDAEQISDYLIEKGEFEQVMAKEIQEENIHKSETELKKHIDNGTALIEKINNIDLGQVNNIIDKLIYNTWHYANPTRADELHDCIIINSNSKAAIKLSARVVESSYENFSPKTLISYTDNYMDILINNPRNVSNINGDTQLENVINQKFKSESFVYYGKDYSLVKDIIKKNNIVEMLGKEEDVLLDEEKLDIIQENVKECKKITESMVSDNFHKELVSEVEKGIVVEEQISDNNKRFGMYNDKDIADSNKKFAIYQLKADKNRDYLFESYNSLMERNLDVDRANYDLVWVGDYNPDITFDSIFEKFNVNRPLEFKGHSISVSDIIVINDGVNISTAYVDSIGFKNINDFLKPEEEKINEFEEKNKEIEHSEGILIEEELSEETRMDRMISVGDADYQHGIQEAETDLESEQVAEKEEKAYIRHI